MGSVFLCRCAHAQLEMLLRARCQQDGPDVSSWLHLWQSHLQSSISCEERCKVQGGLGEAVAVMNDAAVDGEPRRA